MKRAWGKERCEGRDGRGDERGKGAKGDEDARRKDTSGTGRTVEGNEKTALQAQTGSVGASEERFQVGAEAEAPGGRGGASPM